MTHALAVHIPFTQVIHGQQIARFGGTADALDVAVITALDKTRNAFIKPDRNAARMVSAEPSVARTGSRVLAPRIRAHANADAPTGASEGGAREHLFGAGRDRGGELFDQAVEQAVDGFGHSLVRAGQNSGRWGSFSSRFDNELLEPMP